MKEYFLKRNVGENDFSACVREYTMCVQVLLEARVGIRFSGTGVINYCKLLYECREPNPIPLQEQQVLIPVDLTLQSRENNFFF